MPDNKTLGVKILWGIEVVVSVRVLLFSLPVLINKNLAHNFFLGRLDDGFILVLTLAALIYFAAGVAGIINHKLWKLFHYIGMGLVFILTAALFRLSVKTGVLFPVHYFSPVVFSSLLTVLSIKLSKHQTSNSEQVAASWKSILIVDDDETILKSLRPVLISNGFSVLTATSGEEGLNIVKTQQPDFIILDVILPGMKGREVCKILKADPTTKHIPVIFLSAKGSQDDIQAAKDLGAERYLTKPVNNKVLLATIREILQ